MKYELEVNLPNRPQGSLVEVTGFGTFKNGGVGLIDPDRVELYRLNNRKPVYKTDENGDSQPVMDEEGHQVWEDPTPPDELNWPDGITCRALRDDERPTAKPEPTNDPDSVPSVETDEEKEGGE